MSIAFQACIINKKNHGELLDMNVKKKFNKLILQDGRFNIKTLINSLIVH